LCKYGAERGGPDRGRADVCAVGGIGGVMPWVSGSEGLRYWPEIGSFVVSGVVSAGWWEFRSRGWKRAHER
jgi:hypothetical protein